LLCSKTAVVAKQSRMKGYTNVIIPSLPWSSRCFSCRDIDPDSTRFIECHCGGLSDCNRHTWSDGGKARQPMVVERMILKRSSIGPLQIRPGHLFVLHCISFSLNGAGALLARLEIDTGRIGSAFLPGRPRAASKGI